MLLNGMSPNGETIQILVTNMHYIPTFHINIVSLDLIEEKGFSWEPKRNMVVNPNGEDFCKVFRMFCQKVLEYVPVEEPTAYAISEQVNTTSEKETPEKKRSKSPKVSVVSL
jgi:hypothetical protein